MRVVGNIKLIEKKMSTRTIIVSAVGLRRGGRRRPNATQDKIGALA
jgi:hypothetical protein